jgi:hypothetical protein
MLKPEIERLCKEMLMEHFSSEIIKTIKQFKFLLNFKSQLTPIAATNVRTIMARATMVAIILEEENIFFICFTGPIRKHVLKNCINKIN